VWVILTMWEAYTTCSRAFSRTEAPLAGLARTAWTRWTIKEGIQQTRAIRLDQYEVRSWQRRYRHIALCIRVPRLPGRLPGHECEREEGGMSAT